MGIEIDVSGVMKEAADLTPAGSIVAFGGTVAPAGWLLCDGTQVSRTTYAELFAVIGTAFGSGDGLTMFHLPDLRGRFLRGRAAGQTTDPDRASRSAMNTGGNTGDEVGSVQDDQFESHTHTGPSHTHTTPVASGSGSTFDKLWGGLDGDAGSVNRTSSSSGTGACGTSGGSETRPINAYVNFIIKY
jgi:microcystin-dependent protein